MAFSAGNSNFRQAWSAETTLHFLRLLTFSGRLNATYDGDAMSSAQVFAQNPNYNIAVTTPARKAAWSTPREPSASRITINMDQEKRVENMLWVQDEVENAVRNYRGRLQAASLNALAANHEDNVVAYILALVAGGDHSTNDNANAGQITQHTFTDANAGYSRSTGKLNGTAAQRAEARAWPLEFLTDARVVLRRGDVDPGTNVIGGSVSPFWAAFPVEIYTYGMAAELESKGLSLDFTASIIRDLAIFGSAFMGTYRGFDLFTTNALKKPATNAADWFAIAGANQAVAGPMRPVRNYVTEPQNASAERFEFRHNVTFGRQLINSELIHRARFDGQGNV